ncbi:MAG: rhodanese, partial [Caulobacter sp. 12-67-6]
MPTTVKEMLAAANDAVPRIAPAEARAMAEQPQVVLLDVRDAAE